MAASKKILIIDDDKKFALGLVAVLNREGYHVQHVTNGIEGLTAIRSFSPDLILCDVMMPPPNGIQLKKDLASDPLNSLIPFIFITARTAQVDKLAGLQSGADDYINKPFDVDELLARIQSVMARDERGRARGVQESQMARGTLRSGISGNLSHEMRTPLMVILSTLDMILDEKFKQDDENLTQFIKLANSSAHRLEFLIEDLEMLYQIDQGKLTARFNKLDPDLHVRAPLLKVLKMWEMKQLDVRLIFNPNKSIYAPQEEFGHILAHLFDNACKFSQPKGKLTVMIKMISPGVLHCEISDDGAGIPDDMKERVFERYFQISQGYTRKYSGLGVGLTLARTYARAWGGDVQILDGQPGCKVRMILPQPTGSE